MSDDYEIGIQHGTLNGIPFDGFTEITIDEKLDDVDDFDISWLDLASRYTFSVEIKTNAGFSEYISQLLAYTWYDVSYTYETWEDQWRNVVPVGGYYSYNLGPIVPYVPPAFCSPFERKPYEIVLPSPTDGVAEALPWRALTTTLQIPREIPSRAPLAPTPPPKQDFSNFEEPGYVARTRPSRR